MSSTQLVNQQSTTSTSTYQQSPNASDKLQNFAFTAEPRLLLYPHFGTGYMCVQRYLNHAILLVNKVWRFDFSTTTESSKRRIILRISIY